MSEVRGSGRECQAGTAQERPKGATPRLRSGEVAGRSYLASEVLRGGGGKAKRSHPAPETRGGGQEEPYNIQGAVAARAQEGLEELSHVEGQEGQQ